MFYVIPVKERYDFTGGVCLTHPDPDLWHSENDDDLLEAKRVCRTCPIMMECRAYAIRNEERLGVWGGTDRWDRGYNHSTRF